MVYEILPAMRYVLADRPRILSLPRMPDSFTIPELQEEFERLVGELDKRNFRKFLRVFGVVRRVRGVRKTGRRPARLYSYRSPVKQLVVL